EGPCIGTDHAVSAYGVDDAFPIDDVDDILPGLLEGRARIHCRFGHDAAFDDRLLTWMRRLRSLRGGGVTPREVVDLGHLLHDMRLYKSAAELHWMRKASAIAVQAHLEAMRVGGPGV